MDLGEWLRRLDLEQYEPVFRENKIDDAVLPNLTAEDLKDLGIEFVGHRRKLLDAIAALRTEAPTPLSDAPVAIEKAGSDTAERRQVTVMFSDLVGSTALSASMDPEDLRELIMAYQTCVADTVRRFGGFVAKYMGDGVLVYFGYPQAHEHDAERAVRAGLELVSAVSNLKTHAALQTRVGIATGLVVVGDLIGAGASQEQAIVGETPNLAARLQGIAEPNSIVIADGTRQLVGDLFELEDLGRQELKGISAPVRAWAARRPASVEGRFEAMHANGLTDLVGREEELNLLLRRWSKAKSGEGQVVLLSGEAGIGKSRLTAEVLERLATEPHTRLRYFCSPQHTDSAFYPTISQMERAAGFAHDDTLQAKLDKLDTLLAKSFTSPQDLALLAEMLSLTNDGRYPTLELAPQQRRQRTLEALTTQIEALAQRSPVLMIFEDAHWADPTSVEAFSRAVDRMRALSVMLVVTYRPEFEAPWIGQPHVTALTINRLGQREIAAMIDGVTGDNPLLASIKQDIVERTDGIPLFVEEMTKAVLEASGQEDAKRAVTSIPAPSLAVPASLHASLMARLDRLGSAKEVAQIGAAIGREFSHALLVLVARKPPAELGSAIDRLIQAGLLFRRGVPPHATYLFKHALVQDAAYGTLLRQPRCALHARIAQTLESQFAEMAESQPELLARHCTEAGQIEKAAGLWGKAGQRSLERSALMEAVAQLTRALDQITRLPGTPALRREQIKLQIAIITPLIHTKGYAAPETKAAAERARLLIEQAEALGERPEDPLLLFSALNGAWLVNYAAGNAEAIRDLSRQFLELAQKQTATAPIMLAHRIEGTSMLHVGELRLARRHLDLAVEMYEPEAHRALATRFGQDVRMVSLLRRAMTLWLLGYPEAALADSEHSVSDARAIGHVTTLFFALSGGYWANRMCGNYPAADAFVQELASLAEEKDVFFWRAAAMIGRGCLHAVAGEPQEAAVRTTEGLNAYRSTGARLFIAENLSYLAKAQSEIGQLNQAWASIVEALNAIDASNERWGEAEVHRVAGEIVLMSPDAETAKAEAYFERSLEIARQQQAKSWELRASMSMARLWRDQGKRHEARELLAPVYGWFTEGFDTLDLKQAKALLGELA